MKMFKKLNREGFTLIELLAVIVILAIVMGISATGILNSINNSRKSSLHSAAQTYASNINTWATEDALVQNNSERKLGDTFETLIKTTNKGKWVCLGSAGNIVNGGSATSLINALGVSTNDVLTTGTIPTLTAASGNNPAKYTITSGASGNCSAIRYNYSAGAYEILLVAKTNGKYYVTSEGTTKNYAFSRATTYATSITD